MAGLATTFVLNQPTPVDEGEVLVLSADQKGIVMRRPADAPAPKAHRTKGDKASRKRMATVGTVYSVDRYRRTAEEVVAAYCSMRRESPRSVRRLRTKKSGRVCRGTRCRVRERNRSLPGWWASCICAAAARTSRWSS